MTDHNSQQEATLLLTFGGPLFCTEDELLMFADRLLEGKSCQDKMTTIQIEGHTAIVEFESRIACSEAAQYLHGADFHGRTCAARMLVSVGDKHNISPFSRKNIVSVQSKSGAVALNSVEHDDPSCSGIPEEIIYISDDSSSPTEKCDILTEDGRSAQPTKIGDGGIYSSKMDTSKGPTAAEKPSAPIQPAHKPPSYTENRLCATALPTKIGGDGGKSGYLLLFLGASTSNGPTEAEQRPTPEHNLPGYLKDQPSTSALPTKSTNDGPKDLVLLSPNVDAPNGQMKANQSPRATLTKAPHYIICVTCKRMFSERQFYEHVKKREESPCKPPYKIPYPRPCPYCKKLFRSKQSFSRHKIRCLYRNKDITLLPDGVNSARKILYTRLSPTAAEKPTAPIQPAHKPPGYIGTRLCATTLPTKSGGDGNCISKMDTSKGPTAAEKSTASIQPTASMQPAHKPPGYIGTRLCATTLPTNSGGDGNYISKMDTSNSPTAAEKPTAPIQSAHKPPGYIGTQLCATAIPTKIGGDGGKSGYLLLFLGASTSNGPTAAEQRPTPEHNSPGYLKDQPSTSALPTKSPNDGPKDLVLLSPKVDASNDQMKENQSPSGTLPKAPHYIICVTCKRKFSKTQFYEHLKKGESPCKPHNKIAYPRPCPYCKKLFKSKQSFSRHKAKCLYRNKDITSLPDGVNSSRKILYPRLCPNCKKLFKTKQSFWRHKATCFDGGLYINLTPDGGNSANKLSANLTNDQTTATVVSQTNPQPSPNVLHVSLPADSNSPAKKNGTPVEERLEGEAAISQGIIPPSTGCNDSTKYQPSSSSTENDDALSTGNDNDDALSTGNVHDDALSTGGSDSGMNSHSLSISKMNTSNSPTETRQLTSQVHPPQAPPRYSHHKNTTTLFTKKQYFEHLKMKGPNPCKSIPGSYLASKHSCLRQKTSSEYLSEPSSSSLANSGAVEDSTHVQPSEVTQTTCLKFSYPRQCPHCKKHYSSRQSFFRHKANNCVSVSDSSNNDNSTKRRYPRQCPNCKKLYSTRQSFCRHKVYSCVPAPDSSDNDDGMLSTEEEPSSIVLPTENDVGDGRNTCIILKPGTVNAHGPAEAAQNRCSRAPLVSANPTRLDAIQLRCETCKQQFSKSAYYRHLKDSYICRKERGEITYPRSCPICGKVCSAKSSFCLHWNMCSRTKRNGSPRKAVAGDLKVYPLIVVVPPTYDSKGYAEERARFVESRRSASTGSGGDEGMGSSSSFAVKVDSSNTALSC